MQQQTRTAETEEFMAVAAHDLRNPVAVVRAAAQMAERHIRRGDMDAAQKRLSSIVAQTERITDMLETFLDAARLENGPLPLHLEHVDLADVVRVAAERARALLGEHSDRGLAISVPEGYTGEWDRGRVERAIRALLTNALQYGDSREPVRVEAYRKADRVHMHVSGGGRGPNDEEVAHLFERFFRGPSAAEAGHSGSGLGLFTARGIARCHGGDVRLVGGDCFELELPLAD